MASEIGAKSRVLHPRLGTGEVVCVVPGTDDVIVRFGNAIEQCRADSLTPVNDPFDDLTACHFTRPLEAVTHFQALAIASANAKWGVFNASRIDLLPHQLWVCREARRRHPCRLMVADDVGLGKTIEAGIILQAYCSANPHARILVLAPASLVSQWQERINYMFDRQLAIYEGEQDTPRSGFWKRELVVASYYTLANGRGGRLDRLLAAAPWDLVIVDEAHHLNCEEHQGKTQTYALVETMLDHRRIKDMIFFSGTPHRGKDFGFLSLMHLLSSEFNPQMPQEDQIELLRKYMIRNNKYTVTDLAGNRLFQQPKVVSNTYAYSPAEEEFYKCLTAFIRNGFIYADSQTHTVSRSVALVLICMQKLASSSVAAIRCAIEKRLHYHEAELRSVQAKLEALRNGMDGIEATSTEALDDDSRAAMEEQLVETSGQILQLMENEGPALQQLLELARNVQEETKLQAILQDVRENFSGEQVLFFTEYKATQRLLYEALMREYGCEAVVFINGDARLDDVQLPDGSVRSINSNRVNAAARFNRGDVRFIIATEAAGEGIDLQENCHVMFHVDLPWNPMRLHQRVGRLNRYGQKRQVIVHSFRNPDTVEARIWEKLNGKIASINEAFGAVMEEREDLFMLVLGMTPPRTFNELFGRAVQCGGNVDSLNRWFDQATARFGGQDAVDVARRLVGDVSRFDFQQCSEVLPKTDLPDLQPFFRNVLELSDGKRLMRGENGTLQFKTPTKWQEEDYRIVKRYDNLVFSRKHKGDVLIGGVGTAVFDMGLKEAQGLHARTAIRPSLENPLLIYSACERYTDGEGEKLLCYYGCSVDEKGKVIQVLSDWELLLLLNKASVGSLKGNGVGQAHTHDVDALRQSETEAKAALLAMMAKEKIRPENPVFLLEGILVPA